MVTGETATGLSTINRLVLVEASNSNKTEERCFKRKITTQIQYLVVDDDAGVVLEVDELPVLAAEGFPLPDHYGRHHFLAQLRLALLDSSQNLVNTGWWSILFGTMLPPYHVPAAGGGQPVEPAPDPVHGDHVPARHTVQCNKLQYSTVQTAYRFLPPVLSAQFMTAPTGQASEIRNFAPAAPPRPVANNNIQLENSE